MKQIFTFILIGLASINSYSQDTGLSDKLIELGKLYRNFMFRNNPPPGTNEKLTELKSEGLGTTVEFIKQTITPDNQLTEESFLRLPDTVSLRYIYLVRLISLNIQDENPRDNHALISDSTNSTVNYYILADNYYDMLFNGIGNKNQPFDLTKINFDLDKYNLNNETEKGIFFLKAMDLCGMTIWGYMNIVRPPNYKAAMNNIRKFPRFNGQPYYQYLDLNFPDFNMEIIKEKGQMSYKEYYIDKYLNTLIYHYLCLSQKKKFEDQKMDLVLGSILRDKQYYKYSKNYKEQLEGLFKTQEYH